MVSSRAFLTRHSYPVQGRRLHLTEVLVVDDDPDRIGIDSQADMSEIARAVSARLGGEVAASRIVVLKRTPQLLALVLECLPGVHPATDATLEELVQRFGEVVRFRRRGFALPVTRKRDGERVRPWSRMGGGTSHPAGRRRLIFHLSRIEVGLGDRIVGLASAVVLARALDAEIILDRPFLPEVFECASGEYDLPARGFDFDYLDTRFEDYERLGQSDFSELAGDVHIIGNECFHYSLYQNPHVRHRLTDFDTDLRAAYREIFDSILTPRPQIRDTADRIVEALEAAGGGSWSALQLRTGYLEREFPFHSRGDVVRCCRAMARRLADQGADGSVFVTADHAEMAHFAQDVLESEGQTVLSIDAPVLHVSYSAHRGSEAAREKLIVDLLVLSRAPQLFFSFHSNFGRVAFLAGARRPGFGFYGRNFELVGPVDPYLASSKHLVYNNSVGAAFGGLLRLRYHGERSGMSVAGLVIRSVPGFLARLPSLLVTPARWGPGEMVRLFVESLHNAEDRSDWADHPR